ncbi:MAG: DUF3299 domain-containing protein [Gemmatimonadota bacterium]
MTNLRNTAVAAPGPRRSGIAPLLILVALAFMSLLASPAALGAQSNGDAAIADWRMLAGLDYETGAMSEALKELDGKRVKVPGYMVPLDDSASGVAEFILVPYYGACIHTPPPPPNQMVYVRMNSGRRVDVNLWDPLWIEGELHVSEIDSPYGAVGHQISGLTVSPYSW